MKLDGTYRRTAAGSEALQSTDTAVPVDYRRMLCIIDGDTHANVVRGRLRQYSDALIADWLAELEEIGYIEKSEAAAFDLDFKPLASDDPLSSTLSRIPSEQQRLEDEAKVADIALKDKGAYLATARLENRGPLLKDPAQTVVLLVEDDPDQAALADLRVSMAGYRVRLARSVSELVMALTSEELPDLVLLDVMLPDGNGFGILTCMRTDPRLALLPVIMLTALTGAADIQRGLDVGADGYVTKPYSKDILVYTIRQVLQQT